MGDDVVWTGTLVWVRKRDSGSPQHGNNVTFTSNQELVYSHALVVGHESC
jgi:hypothetical protein